MKLRWLVAALLAAVLATACAPEEDGRGPAEPVDPPGDVDDGY